jgi:PiT family inorganic phosphate transporter
MDLLASWLGTTDPFAMWLVAAAVVFGFYMAWTIGANDVGNAMGTSVGSGSLTFARAILVAGVMELAGAVLAGSHVTDTIRKGIIDPQLFGHEPALLVLGMLSVLLASAVWLHVATWLSLPVSTTHAVVGAVVGFGVFSRGFAAVEWNKVLEIAVSWVVSPLAGALFAYLLFRFIRRSILNAADPERATRRLAPLLAGLTVGIILLAVFYEGLKNLHLDLPLPRALAVSALSGLFAAGAFYLLIRRAGRTSFSQLGRVESVFMILQIMTASYVAFAHGANDVANAIGPVAAVVTIVQQGTVAAKSAVPLWILMFGGAGIVVGLATWGYRVMRTIGKSITELTPTRGFCAEFATATVVLFCSKMGLPMSTTHTIVGAVIGVGLARGLDAVNLKVIRSILSSWVLTVPVSALLTMAIYWLALALIPAGML